MKEPAKPAFQPRPSWPFPTIEVLVVMDGKIQIEKATGKLLPGHYASFGPGDLSNDATYGDKYFGLSEFIKTISTAGNFFIRFNVTKAHREKDVDGAADIENFRFDQTDLSVYDEIWLFGVAAAGETDAVMSENELAALATFMDGGGGVFATGDHENLGVELNGKVPRVRSMRKWFWPNPGPDGEPAAPSGLGADRIETTQPGEGETTSQFDDQSDDIPQPITLLWYIYGTGFLTETKYPHPLLCGVNGPIKVLPDHMHEGEVISPWSLNAPITYPQKNFTEYPADPHGNQVRPQIVAWGKVLGEPSISNEPAHAGTPSVAIPRDFGVVGAYDGHAAGVGRVAVDSTWHHFFNINLTGDPVAPFPKTQGFNASPSGMKVLAQIQNYYRNIAFWIARPETQAGLFVGTAWLALHSQPLSMLVRSDTTVSFKEMMKIGSLALENIHRFLSPCTVIQIVWSFGNDHVPIFPPLPWLPHPGGDPATVDPSIILQAVFGGAIIAIAEKRAELGRLDEKQATVAITEAVTSGMMRGLRELGASLGKYSEGLHRLSTAWSQLPESGTKTKA